MALACFATLAKSNFLSGYVFFLFFLGATLEDGMNQKPSPVVLVEDEWLLRLFAVEIVEDAGLVAVEAANADEAIAILERRVSSRPSR